MKKKIIIGLMLSIGFASTTSAMERVRIGLFNRDTELVQAAKAALRKEIGNAYQIGEAFSKGDCFYDSFAQGLNRLNRTQEHTLKTMRKACALAVQNFKVGSSEMEWLEAMIKDPAERVSYNINVEFAADQLSELIGLKEAIWGQPVIDGVVLCKKYGVNLHVIEIHDDFDGEGTPLVSHRLNTPNGASRSIDLNEIPEANTITIANYHSHFVPLYRVAAQAREPLQPRRVSEQESNDFATLLKDEDVDGLRRLHAKGKVKLEDEIKALIKQLYDKEKEARLMVSNLLSFYNDFAFQNRVDLNDLLSQVPNVLRRDLVRICVEKAQELRQDNQNFLRVMGVLKEVIGEFKERAGQEDSFEFGKRPRGVDFSSPEPTELRKLKVDGAWHPQKCTRLASLILKPAVWSDAVVELAIATEKGSKTCSVDGEPVHMIELLIKARRFALVRKYVEQDQSGDAFQIVFAAFAKSLLTRAEFEKIVSAQTAREFVARRILGLAPKSEKNMEELRALVRSGIVNLFNTNP